MRALWNGELIAESTDTVVVENNHYFPRSALKAEHFQPSDTHSICPWKGEASYLHVVVDGKTNRDAAWFYPQTSEAAKSIEGRVAFWRGVEVVE